MCQNCCMAAQRAYAGVPAEERRAQRRAALLDAALDIIGTTGFARLTVAGLCTAAGLNERYYYESFKTLDDVLGAVFDQVTAELAEAILTATVRAPDDALSKARAAIGAAVDLMADDPRKARVAFVEALTSEALTARRIEIITSFATLVSDAGREFYGPAITLQVGSRAQFAAMHLVGGILETMTAWLSGALDMSRDQLVDESAGLFVAVADYVRASAGQSDGK